jgi:G3E family GTPase
MKKIPLTIITWFLGAGKTTLVNYILKKNKDLKIALIVNEFGDVALESQFIHTTDEEIVEMSNWCMCCVVRKDIIETVQNLLKKRPDVDYIIIEASGLSDPVPIAQTFLMNMEDTVRMDSVLCVVDCINVEKNFQQFEIATAQIQYADIVLLSKHTMMHPDRLKQIEELIYKFSPFTRIIKIDDQLPLSLIIDTNQFDHHEIKGLEDVEESTHEHAQESHHVHDEHCHHEDHHHVHDEHCHHEHGEHCHHEDHHHVHDEHCHHEHGEHCKHEHHHEHHHESVDEVFIKLEAPINMEKFTTFLKELPKWVYRGKWILYSNDTESQWKKLLFQYVGARIDVFMEDWKEGEKKQSALVFIWKNYDTAMVKKAFESCEA